jgi:hypothetical protein
MPASSITTAVSLPRVRLPFSARSSNASVVIERSVLASAAKRSAVAPAIAVPITW